MTRARLIATLIAASTAGCHARAGIYEQPYSFSTDPGAFASAEGPMVADEVFVPFDVRRTDLRWYGSFASGDPLGHQDLMTFTFQVYDDAGGGPSFTPRYTLRNLVALGTDTGMREADGRSVYEFLAMDVVLNVHGGEWQYIAILENDGRFAPGEYRWSNSVVGPNDVNWV